MSDIKFYEEGDFFFEFMPQNGPYEGTLVVRFPELDPYIDVVCLTKDKSRNEFAKRAQEECEMSR